MVRRSRAALATFALLAASVLLRAQAPPSPSAPGAQAPTFHGGTDVVQVDVIVNDKNGRFVDDLHADDFTLTDEGTAQPIDQFFLVGGSAASDTAAPGTAPRASTPRTVAPKRVFVVVFDDEHLTPGGFKRVQAAALSLFEKQFQPGDIGGVVVNGQMANKRLTSDREELLAAVRAAKPNSKATSRTSDLAEWPVMNEAEAVQIQNGGSTMSREVLNHAVERACEDDPDICKRGRDMVEMMVQEKAQRITTDLVANTNQTLTTLDALMNGLERLEGRKTVLLLTEGMIAEQSWPLVQQAVALAARANARIYSLDARGLHRVRMETTYTPHDDSLGNLLASFDVGADSINSLAVDTGGFVVRNTNIFDDAVAQIARDAGSYYVLGFRPAALRDGKFHRVKVGVKRAGLVVRARRGYVATPAAMTVSTAPEQVRLKPDTTTAATTMTTTEPPDSPSSASPSSSDVASGFSRTTSDVASGFSRTTAPALPAPAPAAGSVHLRPDDVKNVGTLAANAAADAQATAGWEAYQRGDVDTARASLSAAASSPAARPWVHYALGQAEYALRHFPAAIAAWERVRANSPDFEPVYFDLADGYMQTQHYEQGIEVLRAAQRRWPHDAEVFNALGVMQVKRNALDDAVKSFEEAVTAAPQEGVGYFNLAKTLELRWIKSRRYNELTRLWVSNENDRRNAVARYEQYLAIGGPFADAAREGLRRLEWGVK